MQFLDLFDRSAAQESLAPLIIALIVAVALSRTRVAWLAIVAGYATTVFFNGDFAFSPLTATRKVILIGFVAALVGLAVDLIPRKPRHLGASVAIIAGIVSIWAFLSVLSQREVIAGVTTGVGIAAFVAVLAALVLRLRNDGLQAGAAGLGLGLATGIAGVLSASLGYLFAGIAVAAAAGALILTQVILSRRLAAGFTGALPLGVLTALFAAATLLLAQLPWYTLPLLLLVPLAASLPVPAHTRITASAAISCGYALAAALVPVLAAWYAARGSLT